MKKRLVLRKEVKETLKDTALEILWLIAMLGIVWLIIRIGA